MLVTSVSRWVKGDFGTLPWNNSPQSCPQSSDWLLSRENSFPLHNSLWLLPLRHCSSATTASSCPGYGVGEGCPPGISNSAVKQNSELCWASHHRMHNTAPHSVLQQRYKRALGASYDNSRNAVHTSPHACTYVRLYRLQSISTKQLTCSSC